MRNILDFIRILPLFWQAWNAALMPGNVATVGWTVGDNPNPVLTIAVGRGRGAIQLFQTIREGFPVGADMRTGELVYDDTEVDDDNGNGAT